METCSPSSRSPMKWTLSPICLWISQRSKPSTIPPMLPTLTRLSHPLKWHHGSQSCKATVLALPKMLIPTYSLMPTLWFRCPIWTSTLWEQLRMRAVQYQDVLGIAGFSMLEIAPVLSLCTRLPRRRLRGQQLTCYRILAFHSIPCYITRARASGHSLTCRNAISKSSKLVKSPTLKLDNMGAHW